ncbi:hypothetical protein MMPV_010137 [Pyropia vietnamensis]
MEDAKANWHAAAAGANDLLAVEDVAAIARAKMRAVYDGFVDAPETLTLASVKEQLLPTHIQDVGCLHLAHRVLQFADRLGVFGGESAAVTSQRRRDLFESVYLPMLTQLGKDDHGLVAVIVRHAAEKGLVEQLHVSVIGTALLLEKKFSTQLQVVLMRLDLLEEAVKSGGEILRRALEELRSLQGYLRALNAGVDAVATFVEGAGAAVVCQYLADPTDIAAARQILKGVIDVKSTLTNAQLQPLLVAMSPYASLEELNADLAFTERCLCVDASAKEAGVDCGAADAVGDMEAEVRAPDEVKDQFEKSKTATTDAVVRPVVDKVMRMKRSAPEPGRDERAPLPLAAPAGMHGGSGGSADAPAPGPVAPASGDLVSAMQEPAGTGMRQFGADSLAGVAGWSSAVLTSKLVDYASFVPPERDEFDGVVRANAKHHLINGACVVRCEQADEVVVGLLGDWRQRIGPRLTVQCFVRDAKKYAPCL